MFDEILPSAFAPYEELAIRLVPFAAGTDDGSHDLAHIARVFSSAMKINDKEGGYGRVLAAAVLLHDCVAVEKNSPLRSQASQLAAQKAREILFGLGWKAQEIDKVAHAIEAHSFSAGILPVSVEAKILQDADRLDALGMIGAARCFYTAGRMNAQLYACADPSGAHRPLDDRTFALDHFPAKLFKLVDGFQTETGRAMAAERHRRLEEFYTLMLEEIG